MSSKELYREFSDGKQGLTKAEFTVEVQIPHNIERGPLLVTDIKRRVTAFVSPKERGYDVSWRLSHYSWINLNSNWETEVFMSFILVTLQ